MSAPIKNQIEDKATAKGNLAGEQKKPDAERPATVTPDNENGNPGAPSGKHNSNKDKGPKGENL